MNQLGHLVNANQRFKKSHLPKLKIAFRVGVLHLVLLRSGSGRSVAWLARVVRVHEVVSSNLTAPTTGEGGGSSVKDLERF